MTSMTIFLAIGFAALATYLVRFSGLLLGRFIRVTPKIEQGLHYVPIGVFAALITPSIVLQPGTAGHPDWKLWLTSIVALCIAWLSKSPLWTMIVGVVGIALLRLF
ncbi:AzlD domain-containing protein [Fodinisporobacter ferrooxydans]|uniref:AzlD domain-containing protein n=1 Tax=Fodinisporobacter ferrooxydans TaxID=2901836 RepID=A0ABY4CGM7_9BACL|nr:AzlD domain-containing protein [Alicyclobacillaceae bacterium MYW30-H2]